MTKRSSAKKATVEKKRSNSNVLEESKMTKTAALSSLKSIVPQIFMDAQKPNQHLRSDSIRLRDIQLACCLNSPRLIGVPEDIDYEGEEAFVTEIFRNINKVLNIRRKEPHADRIVRFIAGFLQYNQQRDVTAKQELAKLRELKNQIEAEPKTDDNNVEKEDGNNQEGEDDPMIEDDLYAEIPLVLENEVIETEVSEEVSVDQEVEDTKKDREANEEEEDDDEEEIETVSSRLVEKLLRHLLRGFTAKLKNVRSRCCQIVALSIGSMGEIDEDLYQDLKTALFERIIDKEASVRIQAATTLCRLQSADADLDPIDNKTIFQKLMWSLEYDTSAEVRRVILFNIDPVPEALPYIVGRARDPDATNRRIVYLKPLSDIQDFRMLSFDDRNKILKWGLNDRNHLVKKAATTMLSEKWIGHANNNLIEFLERLEILNPEVTEIAEGVFDAFFAARSEFVNEITFDAELWNNLTPESAFLAKALIKFLQKDESLGERLDSILPEVTRHAFNLKYYNDLYRSSPQETANEYEFITSQMLETALYLDYADEVGRRKMFELLREILKACELSDDHLSKIVRIFRLISLDERDFTRTIIEIISDIQEQMEPSLDLEETPTKRSRLDESLSTQSIDEPVPITATSEVSDMNSLVIKLRCLSICKRMLENSQESLVENSNLYGLLNDLIVPAVQTSDAVLREEGLHCLGLCCTLDKGLAQYNIALFLQCIKSGHEELMKKAIMILFDLMMTYGVQNLTAQGSNPDEIREVFEFCLDHDSPEIQSITTIGLAKLMLAKRFHDDEILRLMILLYFFPTVEPVNNKIQQCLTYFFPAYCYSSADHQKFFSNVTIPALEELCNTHMDLQEDEVMVNPIQIADMLADWTDPRKLANLHLNDLLTDDEKPSDIPGCLAIEALNIIYNEHTGVKRKTMAHFLLKLPLDKLDLTQLLEIQRLMTSINTDCPIKEYATRNAMTKLSNTINSAIEDEESISGTRRNSKPSTSQIESRQQSPVDDPSQVHVDNTSQSPRPKVKSPQKDKESDPESEADSEVNSDLESETEVDRERELNSEPDKEAESEPENEVGNEVENVSQSEQESSEESDEESEFEYS